MFKQTMLTAAVLAAAIAPLAPLAARPAVASPRTAVVSLAGYDLQRGDDAAALNRRIVRAANQVCREDSPDLRSALVTRACANRAAADAQSRLALVVAARAPQVAGR